MNIHVEKLELIQWLSELTDENMLARIKALRSEKDWYDEIPESTKEAIEEGLTDIKKGNTKSFDEVISKHLP